MIHYCNVADDHFMTTQLSAALARCHSFALERISRYFLLTILESNAQTPQFASLATLGVGRTPVSNPSQRLAPQSKPNHEASCSPSHPHTTPARRNRKTSTWYKARQIDYPCSEPFLRHPGTRKTIFNPTASRIWWVENIQKKVHLTQSPFSSAFLVVYPPSLSPSFNLTSDLVSSYKSASSLNSKVCSFHSRRNWISVYHFTYFIHFLPLSNHTYSSICLLITTHHHLQEVSLKDSTICLSALSPAPAYETQAAIPTASTPSPH